MLGVYPSMSCVAIAPSVQYSSPVDDEKGGNRTRGRRSKGMEGGWLLTNTATRSVAVLLAPSLGYCYIAAALLCTDTMSSFISSPRQLFRGSAPGACAAAASVRRGSLILKGVQSQCFVVRRQWWRVVRRAEKSVEHKEFLDHPHADFHRSRYVSYNIDSASSWLVYTRVGVGV